MGEGRRRKLAGDPPMGPKREKLPNERKLAISLFGGMGFAEAAALLAVANTSTRYPASSFNNRKHDENPQ